MTQPEAGIGGFVNVRTFVADTTAVLGCCTPSVWRQGSSYLFRTSTTIAAVFGLTAFAVSVVAGLASGVPATVVLMRAIVAMVACYAVGRFAGHIGEHVAAQFIASYKAVRPIPADPSLGGDSGGGAGAAPVSTGGKEAAEANP
ncbi:MAG: hypothetical protein GIKADHBN_00010 [Phycisphaerales bacterium]|nr:hypothetical protein [Phycisphaerales bacterium]